MAEPAKNQAVDRTHIFYVPERARVMTTRREPSATFVELGFEDGRSLNHHPGQFVQVSVFGYGEAPISVCSSPTRPESFDLCVQPMGNVSRAVADLSAGDWVGIRGPYGRGCFPVDRMKKKDVLLIAGGIGMAPLRGLIQFICDNRDDYGRFMVVYGAKTPPDILFREETEQWTENPDLDFFLTVDEPDDEWEGRTGVVTEPLKEIDIDPENTIAAACGPPVMFRFIAMELLKKKLPEDRIYFSLERRFKCGIGKCGHCQLNDLYVCQDGPVFRYADLLKRTEAGEVWVPEKDQDTA
ncbi:MAG: FAD/NAD(P)-binding protein [Desulfococcaceae bacterium]